MNRLVSDLPIIAFPGDLFSFFPPYKWFESVDENVVNNQPFCKSNTFSVLKLP